MAGQAVDEHERRLSSPRLLVDERHAVTEELPHGYSLAHAAGTARAGHRRRRRPRGHRRRRAAAAEALRLRHAVVGRARRHGRRSGVALPVLRRRPDRRAGHGGLARSADRAELRRRGHDDDRHRHRRAAAARAQPGPGRQAGRQRSTRSAAGGSPSASASAGRARSSTRSASRSRAAAARTAEYVAAMRTLWRDDVASFDGRVRRVRLGAGQPQAGPRPADPGRASAATATRRCAGWRRGATAGTASTSTASTRCASGSPRSASCAVRRGGISASCTSLSRSTAASRRTRRRWRGWVSTSWCSSRRRRRTPAWPQSGPTSSRVAGIPRLRDPPRVQQHWTNAGQKRRPDFRDRWTARALGRRRAIVLGARRRGRFRQRLGRAGRGRRAGRGGHGSRDPQDQARRRDHAGEPVVRQLLRDVSRAPTASPRATASPTVCSPDPRTGQLPAPVPRSGGRQRRRPARRQTARRRHRRRQDERVRRAGRDRAHEGCGPTGRQPELQRVSRRPT